MSDTVINQHERANRIWPILVRYATLQKTITYGKLSKLTGIHHRALRYCLSPIQDYCMTVNIPPLSILVVNQTGLPGSGFIAINSDYFEEGFQEVFEFFPKNPDNPFSFAADGTSYNDLLNSLLEEPEESLDVFAKVKVRGIAQTLFRDALIVAYENRCAFSDISFTETLEAAHIVPWSECDRGDRCNLRNGLLLSSLHHKLFDPNWITITEEYRIEFRDPKMIDGSYTASDKALVMALHRQKMLLPRDKRYWPDLRLIRNRNEKLGWKISTNQ